MLSGALHLAAHSASNGSEACRVYSQSLARILNAALYGAFVVQSDFFAVKLRARDSIIQSCLGAAIKLVPVPGADLAAIAATSAYYAYGAKAFVRPSTESEGFCSVCWCLLTLSWCGVRNFPSL